MTKRPRVYLAGPDVFFPGAAAHARRKAEICAGHGLEGLPPLNEDIGALLAMPKDEAWRAIYLKDVEMMEACDAVVANLTPFMGVSADAGTLIEVGWFLGRGRPVFGYTNESETFAERTAFRQGRVDSNVPWLPRFEPFEDFGQADNLMVAGAAEYGGGLPVFGPLEGEDDPTVHDAARGLYVLPHDYLGVFARACSAAAGALRSK
jgi:nucleoside 2-deoxyribosyltransferase